MNIYEKELIFLSKYFGMREDYVQAGGGNISVKISEKNMLIKASGVSLADVSDSENYTLIDYKMLSEILNKKECSTKEEKSYIDKSIIRGKKPSMESFMHSITDKYTIHLHPIVTNILLCQKNGKELIKKIFKDAIFIDYVIPGMELAKKIKESFEENGKKDIIFLENHGIIVSDNNIENVIKKVEFVIKSLSDYLNYDIARYESVSSIYNKYKRVNQDFSNIIYLTNDTYITNAVKKNNRIFVELFIISRCYYLLWYKSFLYK